MSETPHDIHFALAEFDRSQLPESQQKLQGDEFRQAVQEHLARSFPDSEELRKSQSPPTG